MVDAKTWPIFKIAFICLHFSLFCIAKPPFLPFFFLFFCGKVFANEIDNIINTDTTINFNITILKGKNVTITGSKPLYINSNINVYGRVIFNTPVKGKGSITIYSGGSYRSSKPIGIKVINKGGKIVFK